MTDPATAEIGCAHLVEAATERVQFHKIQWLGGFRVLGWNTKVLTVFEGEEIVWGVFRVGRIGRSSRWWQGRMPWKWS